MRSSPRIRPVVLGFCVLAGLCATAPPARADFRLSDLLGTGATLDVGSLRFENFTLVANTSSFNLSSIGVSTSSGADKATLVFSPINNSLFLNQPGSSINIEFKYDVVGLASNVSLAGVREDLAGAALGDAFGEADANAYRLVPPDFGNNLLGSAVTYVDGLLGNVLEDQTRFAPQPAVRIDALILMQSNEAGAFARLDGFSQSYQLAAVPEPGSLTLSLLGALGLACWHLRQRLPARRGGPRFSRGSRSGENVAQLSPG